MKLKSNQPRASAEQVVKDIRRATRRHYSTEDKIRIALSGLRGELGGLIVFTGWGINVDLTPIGDPNWPAAANLGLLSWR